MYSECGIHKDGCTVNYSSDCEGTKTHATENSNKPPPFYSYTFYYRERIASGMHAIREHNGSYFPQRSLNKECLYTSAEADEILETHGAATQKRCSFIRLAFYVYLTFLRYSIMFCHLHPSIFMEDRKTVKRYVYLKLKIGIEKMSRY